MTDQSQPDDFTNDRYAELIKAAKSRYAFRRLDDDLTGENVALWRHDIDYSPHRALALARIEHQNAVTATYFVLLSSMFYNAFEASIVGILREISSFGHDIGLHYDPSVVVGDVAAHERRVQFEANIVGELIGRPVKSFSLHDPTISQGHGLDDTVHGGLINASAPELRKTFEYCSDSNGMWRYRTLHDVVADPNVRRLYALTHPEWWTPDDMKPWQRVERAIQGRAARVLSRYEAILRQHRPEVIGLSK